MSLFGLDLERVKTGGFWYLRVLARGKKLAKCAVKDASKGKRRHQNNWPIREMTQITFVVLASRQFSRARVFI